MRDELNPSRVESPAANRAQRLHKYYYFIVLRAQTIVGTEEMQPMRPMYDRTNLLESTSETEPTYPMEADLAASPRVRPRS